MPGLYSVGIHPWGISILHWEEQLKLLKEASLRQNVLAIGECGLDTICSTAFSLQEQVFLAQVHWANAIEKPLIIHCVRAWEEVLHLLQTTKNKVPVIFHGFSKNRILADKIIARGYYLSFVKSLLHSSGKETLAFLPVDKIFLETDDASLSIQTIYGLAEQALSIDHNSLVLQMKKNAIAIFGAAVLQL